MSLKETYLQNSGLPIRYQKDIILNPIKNDIESFDRLKNIKENIIQFVKDGNNLLIYSNSTGNGKTTWASKMIKAFIDNYEYSAPYDTPALFINLPKLLTDMKMAIGDEKMEMKLKELNKKIFSAKLVVFDDIAIKELSEYEKNLFYYWVDTRTSDMKSCIFTSNICDGDFLQELLGARVFSRVYKYSERILITDGDNRGE